MTAEASAPQLPPNFAVGRSREPILAMPTGRQSKKALQGSRLERHEAKYIIHPQLIPEIREFIRPFCERDPHADGRWPEYTVTTLQLDNPWLSCLNMKEWEALNRFKLRARTYASDHTAPVFLEVKRKFKGVSTKSRARIPYAAWASGEWMEPRAKLTFRNEAETWGYIEFVRLVKEMGAVPQVLIRYDRESYLGRSDRYARLTIDRRLRYARAHTFELLPEKAAWWAMDTPVRMNRPFSGAILELKTYGDAPSWMIDLVQRFDLVRVGFCKYFNAMRAERMFVGRDITNKLEYAPMR